MSNVENDPDFAAPSLESIAHEHDYFLDLLRDIQAACQIEESDAAEIELVISSLTDFFLEHFAREEEMMSRLRFPEFHRHKELHHEMAFHLRMLGERVAKEHSCTTLCDFCTFFIDWLLQHDQTADAKFRAFVQHLAEERDPARLLADALELPRPGESRPAALPPIATKPGTASQ